MTIEGLCGCAGVTKQAFYKARKARQQKEIDEELVLALVRRVRHFHPRMGTRKLLVVLGRELEEAGVSIGRNKLFALLRKHNLLIKRKRRSVRTTDSRHRFAVYPNALREAAISAPHQALVTDLTYIRTEKGFVFAVFVMDAYSRKIVGYNVAASLEASGCLRATEQALAQLPAGARPIHHSDRGTQYCCADYIDLLKQYGVTISMTEENHCYENGKAERLNGIMKQEYGLGGTLADLAEVRRLVEQAVWLYNTGRPHTKLGYTTPQEVHERASAAA